MRKSLPLIVAVALLGQADALRAQTRRPVVEVRVLGESSPLASAHIYIHHLADLTTRRVQTDAAGSFLFQNLPAGLYKVIAHKSGFMPRVAMLTRTTAEAYQFLEVQLAQRQGGPKEEEDFWAIRAQVPSDVLRDIEKDESDAQIASFLAMPEGLALPDSFHTEMQALTGVDQSASQDGGQLSGAGLGIKGQVGKVEVGLRGRFFQLSAPTSSSFQQSPGIAAGTGQTSSLSIDLARGAGSRVSITSLNNRMVSRTDSGDVSPIDFEHYQVNWSQDVGENGRSDFAAHYTAENNFYRNFPIDPLLIPETSRTWRIEGAYTASFSDRNTLQTGLRYRERQFGIGPDRPGKVYEQQALSSVDLFSRGGLRLQPAVLVEYGLYSTLSDGSLALTPQGGLVLQLAPEWQLKASAARRVYADAPSDPDFLPTMFEQRDLCEQGSQSCYEVSLAHQSGEDNEISFGAVHREVGDTLRLYFSEDFFDRLQSLYLVRGDKLPEVRFGLRRKLSPQVLTSLDSSLATGGGGTFSSANGLPYENQVRYMVTSLDTQLLSSSTGIFVAFHHLEQQLEPVGNPLGLPATQMEFERLQLMLSQNLNVLMDLASDWIIQLNMELSRGGQFTPAVPGSLADDRIRRRILGGIAVKF